MSKGKSRAALIAIVVIVALLGVLSMTGFPISSTSYIMPFYKGIQLGAESSGGVVAIFKPQLANEKTTALRMNKAVEAMKKRMEINGFMDAKVVRVGEDQIRLEYTNNNLVNDAPYTEMLAKENNLLCLDPDGNVVFDSSNIVAVQPGTDSATQKYGISYQLDRKGAAALKKVTETRTGENMIFSLNNETIAAQQIQKPIVNGQSMITQDELDQEGSIEMAMMVSGGPLPFPMTRADLTFFEGAVPRADMHSTVLFTFLLLLLGAVALIVIYRANGAAAAIGLACFAFLQLLALSTIESIRLSTASMAGVVAAILMAYSTALILLEATHAEVLDGKSPSGAVAAGMSRSFGILLDVHLVAALIGAACFFLGTVWLRDAAITLLVGLAFDVFVLVGVLYGCQRLFANTTDRPESFTRFGKAPEVVADRSKKKKSAKKA